MQEPHSVSDPARGELLRDSALIGDIVNAGAAMLGARHIPNSRLLCEHMAAHILNCGRLELYTRWNDRPAGRQYQRILKGLERLGRGEPLQYVLGNAEFLGRKFKVNRHCLIPRPETEELVEWFIGFKAPWTDERPLIADVGTGCGCIAVTLALERPEGRYIALDISTKALELARQNARSYGALSKIKIKKIDILSAIEDNSLNAVISNPPYVRTAEWERLDSHVREYEPRIALDGGKDGLDIIAPLIEQAFRKLKSPGLLCFETGEDLAIEPLLRQAGFRDNMIKHDISGKRRMISALK